MEIYVVQEGDTVYSIAEMYGVTADRLVKENGLDNALDLVIGQTIVITYPSQEYIAQEGDTLDSIANAYNVPVMQLLRNNPYLSERAYLYPGETIVISYQTSGSISINGIIYPFINRETLIKLLPSLTYLSIFNFTATAQGDIKTYVDDSEILQITKEYSVIPLMLLTTLTTRGEPNIETAYDILINDDYQENHIKNILDILKTKGYYGINIIFNYIKAVNLSLYFNFVNKISNRLREEGYLFFITFNYRIELVDDKVTYEEVDYSSISRLVDGISFLKLVWGTNYGPPSPVMNMSMIRTFMDYVVSMVSPDKLMQGSTTISYDWALPYIPDKSIATSLSIDSTIRLAQEESSVMQFDEFSYTPHFTYFQSTSALPVEHIVWSVDARSIDAQMGIIDEHGLSGFEIWNVMTYYHQMWTMIHSQYDIIKRLPLLT